MIGLMFPQSPAVSEWWARAVANLVWNQWRVLDAQYAAGIDLLDAAAGGRADTAPKKQTLEQYALERVGKGLAPPREVYQAQNRGRIDWSRFPDWARPIDPEVFEGSAHEG
jgi:hypothetical protein